MKNSTRIFLYAVTSLLASCFAAFGQSMEINSKAPVPNWMSTYAGSVAGSANGPVSKATFDQPYAIRADSQGRIWVVEATSTGFWTSRSGGHRIRLINTNGMVSTVAGASAFGCVDGPGAQARFQSPTDIVLDCEGNALVADMQNNRIRKIDTNGFVSTFAGSVEGFRDGTGADAQFSMPLKLAIDRCNNLYVADFNNLRIRKITPGGEVTIYAGSTRGFQNGDRLSATFDAPNDLALANDGTLYVSDWNNGAVRKIAPNGMVTTLISGLGYAESVRLDGEGNLYVGNAVGNGNVRKLQKFTPTGRLVWTISCPKIGFKDGEISQAQFGGLGGVLPMPDGTLLVPDITNHRLRQILFAPFY